MLGVAAFSFWNSSNGRQGLYRQPFVKWLALGCKDRFKCQGTGTPFGFAFLRPSCPVVPFFPSLGRVPLQTWPCQTKNGCICFSFFAWKSAGHLRRSQQVVFFGDTTLHFAGSLWTQTDFEVATSRELKNLGAPEPPDLPRASDPG